jgi:hypothetical protein
MFYQHSVAREIGGCSSGNCFAIFCSAPNSAFLVQPPASQQATNALLLLEESRAIGASLSPWATGRPFAGRSSQL